MNHQNRAPDICEHLRKQIRAHQAAIKELRKELDPYVGTTDSQEGDSEELKKSIERHREAIEELQLGLDSQGC